ncbi:hypothetical protein MMU07_20205 [Aquiflexum sp. LQ15W]|uniref:hypothetical protein n=1 Tax=Cognataquiflexum nitidum TaxID=2922272 RepID=UPI001F13744A|nr:hypothetical protein [Cognataquiflexum nitidum]MCH6201913.1 hypothetical protein [Cognataquiflexum nitidum]
MRYLYRFLIFFFCLGLWTGCDSDESPSDVPPKEIFIEDEGGSNGILFPNDNTIVIYNMARGAVLDRNGKFQKGFWILSHVFDHMIVEGNQIFATGKTEGDNRLGVSAYNLNGDFLWEKFVTRGPEMVEAPTLKVLGNELILAFTSTTNEDPNALQKKVYFEVFSKNGDALGSSDFRFKPKADFFASHLVIESKSNFLVQGQRKIADPALDEQGILIYRFKDGKVNWETEKGGLGFSTVTSVIKSPTGDFLFVGSKQTTAWAFLLNDSGNTLWNLDHGDGINRNWFMDAIYLGNSIHFCGFSNATPNQTETALIFSTDLAGGGGIEKIYNGIESYRHNAVGSRAQDEVIFVGTRTVNNTFRTDSWLLFTNGKGE